MGYTRQGLAVAFDTSAGFLTGAWWAGVNVLLPARPHRGVSSWADLISWLEELNGLGVRITHLQLWSHGNRGGPLINGKHPTRLELRSLGLAAPFLDELWLRSCDVGRDKTVVQSIVDLVRATVVCHCVVISAGEEPLGWWRRIFPKLRRRFKPWHQGRCVALRPGDKPAWDPDDESIPGCLVTDLVAPASAYFYSEPARYPQV